ncbi:MAG TPA: GH3 auxin-responsive promoter family protein [Cytophagaceae bacterium]|jgi:hypothetical protein|nr:GH3 auxin-responsive promoter family protein [Cytophagaceae bacterium]
MGIRSFLSKPLAKLIVERQDKWSSQPGITQQRVFQYLIQSAKDTQFGKDHDFEGIKDHRSFTERVPIRDYEGLSTYIQKVVKGEVNVLWPGKPIYFAKTSGTTSGIKYIPITAASIPFHIAAARDALLNYVHRTRKSQFLDKKLMFLSGSPEIEQKNGIYIGRLSGIVNHHVPGYLRTNQMPSYATNCIDDWETKLDTIVEETLTQDMSLISGIPPWVQMYFDRIQAKTGKTISEVFPHFSLFVYGGVNFEPYKARLFESIGKKIDSIETYPASEGFIAFQDGTEEEGLLLLLNSGVFYEFIPVANYFDANPPRLTIEEVELAQNYAVVMSTNAGLWGYSIGDTVKFVSLTPYRIVVTGRIKHFISAFGEHVIGEEVEKAMKEALQLHPEVEVTEFTVAPCVSDLKGQSYHEWLIEFRKAPSDLTQFATDLDRAMVHLNIYYDDLITGNILKPLVLTSLRQGAFVEYMKTLGKLGGQNKAPRLSNDRTFVDGLSAFKI